MQDVPHFSTNRLAVIDAELAHQSSPADNDDVMSERPKSEPATVPSSEIEPQPQPQPQLRLAGTPAGQPSEPEQRVLQLRQEMVLALGSLQRDARMICERLERAGRVDPIREITGSGALDIATDSAEDLIRAVDELLLEVSEQPSGR